MSKTCAKCGAELSFREDLVWNGEHVCYKCLQQLDPIIKVEREQHYTPPSDADQYYGIGWLLFSFKGRINRAKWWGIWILLNIFVILGILIGYAKTDELDIFCYLFAIIVLWPSLAIAAKRLHDSNNSAWLLLLLLLPVVDIWPAVVIMFFKGTHGSNKYGFDSLQGGEKLNVEAPNI